MPQKTTKPGKAVKKSDADRIKELERKVEELERRPVAWPTPWPTPNIPPVGDGFVRPLQPWIPVDPRPFHPGRGGYEIWC